jgi:hypothetical protein
MAGWTWLEHETSGATDYTPKCTVLLGVSSAAVTTALFVFKAMRHVEVTVREAIGVLRSAR